MLKHEVRHNGQTTTKSIECAIFHSNRKRHTYDEKKRCKTREYSYLGKDGDEIITPYQQILVCIEGPSVGRYKAQGTKPWRHDEAGNEAPSKRRKA